MSNHHFNTEDGDLTISPPPIVPKSSQLFELHAVSPQPAENFVNYSPSPTSDLFESFSNTSDSGIISTDAESEAFDPRVFEPTSSNASLVESHSTSLDAEELSSSRPSTGSSSQSSSSTPQIAPQLASPAPPSEQSEPPQQPAASSPPQPSNHSSRSNVRRPTTVLDEGKENEHSVRAPRPSSSTLSATVRIFVYFVIALLVIGLAFALHSLLFTGPPLAWKCANRFQSVKCLYFLRSLPIHIGKIDELTTMKVRGRSALELATKRQHLPIWNFLVHNLDASPDGLLQFACEKGLPANIIHWLVKKAKVSVIHANLRFYDPIYGEGESIRNTTLLGIAAFHDRRDVVDHVLKHQLLPANTKDATGKAMHFNAVMAGSLGFLKWISESFCAPTSENDCRGKRIFDLSEPDNDHFTIAHAASYRGEGHILEWISSEDSGLQHLLTAKSTQLETVLHWSVMGANATFIEHMLGKYIKQLPWTDVNSEGSNLVHLAAQRGDVKILTTLKRVLGKYFIELFTKPNHRGITPFLACSMSNKTTGLSWFASEFTDIAFNSGFISGPHIAASYGNIAPLEWYARISTNMLTTVSQRDKMTPLDYAKLNCRYTTVQYLRKVIGPVHNDNDDWKQKCDAFA